MQDYIAKMRGASDTSSRHQASQEDSESMDTTNGRREEEREEQGEEQGEELQESSDGGVYLE